jgi:hypothetical protein
MRVKMKKVSYDDASREHIYIRALGITVLVFLMLVIIASVAPIADIQNSGSNNGSNFNKFDKAINAYDKAIEVNPQDSLIRYDHAYTYSPINKKDGIEVQILSINNFHGQLELPKSQIPIGRNKLDGCFYIWRCRGC